MRIAAPEFGPLALIALRTGIAVLCLLPLVVLSGKIRLLRDNFGRLLLLGVIGTAIPFTLLSYATLHVSAGYTSIINSTATIFTAFIAWLWVNERLNRSAVLGIVLGSCGVIVLAMDQHGGKGIALIPVLAGLTATLCYGIGANFSKQKLAHTEPLVIALGSQLGATLMLAPLAINWWPEVQPGLHAWLAVSALGVFCTGVAFILFFRLIAHVGVNQAMSVTYLIPFFAIIWGMLILAEQLSLYMMAGGALILLCVGLTTGLLQRRFRRT